MFPDHTNHLGSLFGRQVPPVFSRLISHSSVDLRAPEWLMMPKHLAHADRQVERLHRSKTMGLMILTSSEKLKEIYVMRFYIYINYSSPAKS